MMLRSPSKASINSPAAVDSSIKFKGLTGNGTFKTKMTSPRDAEATWQGAYELATAKAHTR